TDAEHEEVVALGGLYVLGTERHESRRIDNQLRGRSGRQGDPGESRFYLSLEDDLMRMFASERIASIMERLKWPDDEPITARMVTRAVESAQKQIEELNFERRKNILKYDDVMNTQRTVIYEEREKILRGEDFKEEALDMVTEVVERTIAEQVASPALLTERVLTDALDLYEEKERQLGSEVMRELERMVLLSITDTKWREHLYEMDYLQEGIHLRAYGQKDPLTEYQREAFDMFQELTRGIRDDFVRYIYRVELVRQDEPARPRPQRVVTSRGEGEAGSGSAPQARSDKVPRNAPCPCGSG